MGHYDLWQDFMLNWLLEGIGRDKR